MSGLPARAMAEALVKEAITTTSYLCQGASMLFYPAAPPLSARTLTYVAGVIRRHRRRIGPCWRKLNPGRQALLVLAYLRKGETFADLADGFGIGTATAWRYVSETAALLAARAPKLGRALQDAKEAGHACVVIDSTLNPDRPGRRRPALLLRQAPPPRHEPAGHLQPTGDIVWVSGPLPGALHDLAAARIWGILRKLAPVGLVVLGDKGYIGAGPHVRTPYRGRNKPASQKTASRAHAQLRSPGERANAQLKTWRIRDRGYWQRQNPVIPLLARPGKMGLPLVGLVCDDVNIRAGWDGTTVTLRMNLPPRMALVSSARGR
jgi:Helix-turn-helix of DDE superfamily endonuclease/DDE superfamily endonuclease